MSIKNIPIAEIIPAIIYLKAAPLIFAVLPHLLLVQNNLNVHLFPGVPLSDIYSINVIREGFPESIPVFHNTPRDYDHEATGGRSVDIHPLTKYKGYSLGWCRVTHNGPLLFELTVHDTTRVSVKRTSEEVGSRTPLGLAQANLWETARK